MTSIHISTHTPEEKTLVCTYRRHTPLQQGGYSVNIRNNFDTSSIDFDTLEILENDILLYEITGALNINSHRNKNEHVHRNLANGIFSSIYAIVDKKMQQNETYILKLAEEDIGPLIKKYNNDLKIFADIKKHLIDIKFYGKITVPTYDNGTKQYYYMIVPVYNTFDCVKMIDMQLETKIEFLYKLALLLNTLQEKKYMVPDLKHANIGYDNNGEIILIDYDIYTLYHISDMFCGNYTYQLSQLAHNGNFDFYPFAIVFNYFIYMNHKSLHESAINHNFMSYKEYVAFCEKYIINQTCSNAKKEYDANNIF